MPYILLLAGDDGRYKCHACDNLFKTKKRLSFHILKDHPDNLPFICTFCDKTFINASKLSTHMHVHTRDKMDPSTLKENASISEDPIIYSRLSESTMKSVDIASSNLNVKKANRKMRNPTHKKSKATTHKKADCESKTRNYAEGVYPCKVCGVILNNSKRHWHHMESHKDYICKVCGHKSNCKASLITHMKRHDRTPLHTCNYCKKGFEQPEHLAEHIKIHSGGFTLFIQILFQIRKSSPWGSVSYRPFACPSYEASSHVKNYAYSGKLLLFLSITLHNPFAHEDNVCVSCKVDKINVLYCIVNFSKISAIRQYGISINMTLIHEMFI